MRRLLLFDIDGTLMDTRGAGLSALLDAAEEVLGLAREQVPALDLAGATDGGIFRQMLRDAGRAEDDAELTQAYRRSYLDHLERRLRGADFAGELLPGVRALLEALRQGAEARLGLLTGNVRDGAQSKLRRFELDGYFSGGAFGDDAEDRNLLGPIAMHRLAGDRPEPWRAEEVIVIGDTVRDIACAAACGARCLAVATGVHSRSLLEQREPWCCLDDLSDTAAVVELLTLA
ncbi:MAG: haloacid dehalogenase-like hydrolase [Verrucomicrobiales bacterium]|nr:haloacid dehalogenase-like hydrolase [Verrucomicrobiales bacterium]